MPVLLVAVRETFDVVEASLVVVVLGNCRSATLDAGVFSSIEPLSLPLDFWIRLTRCAAFKALGQRSGRD